MRTRRYSSGGCNQGHWQGRLVAAFGFERLTTDRQMKQFVFSELRAFLSPIPLMFRLRTWISSVLILASIYRTHNMCSSITMTCRMFWESASTFDQEMSTAGSKATRFFAVATLPYM